MAVAAFGSIYLTHSAGRFNGATALLALLPLALWAWLWSVVLVTEVRTDDILMGFRRLWPERLLPYDQIVKVEAIHYRPIRDYGGWGVRGVMPVRAFNVSGNRGVLITFVEGKTLMIGSQRADQLALAINGRLS